MDKMWNKNDFPPGVWPTMLTPFNKQGEVDYTALSDLTEWYISRNCAGLFAVCQSSEMFQLSEDEKCRILSTVLQQARGRLPVIVSGHTQETLSEQIEALQRIAELKPDALILVSNRLAESNESDAVLITRLQELMDHLPEALPLGIYECPWPYKRLLGEEVVRFMIESGRFRFIKDTCCDLSRLALRCGEIKNTNLRLFNANTASLTYSLKQGASGYCGVMANFQPEIYDWLCRVVTPDCIHAPLTKIKTIQSILTVCALIEMKQYPGCAKRYLKKMGVAMEDAVRVEQPHAVSSIEDEELNQLMGVTHFLNNYIHKENEL